MSRANPRKAMAALLPLPISCGSDTVVVRPMTLGMYAALERLESPLITGKDPKDVLELIPSLYLLTHDPREVFRGDLMDQAMEWANALPVTAMADIRSACYRQINAAFDVIPESDDDDDDAKKKNDGWIAAIVHWVAENYGWSFREIMWEVPLSAIALLRRQEDLKQNKIFPLSEIEKIDNGEKADS